jgi:hypothetical protein
MSSGEAQRATFSRNTKVQPPPLAASQENCKVRFWLALDPCRIFTPLLATQKTPRFSRFALQISLAHGWENGDVFDELFRSGVGEGRSERVGEIVRGTFSAKSPTHRLTPSPTPDSHDLAVLLSPLQPTFRSRLRVD